MEQVPYVMPEAEVGDLVLWYERGDTSRRPYVCLVEAAHRDCLDLQVLSTSWKGMLKQGARHVSDERLKINPEWAKAGGWDHMRRTKDFIAAAAQVKHLAEARDEVARHTPADEVNDQPDADAADLRQAVRRKAQSAPKAAVS